jgi:hypothetical protein
VPVDEEEGRQEDGQLDPEEDPQKCCTQQRGDGGEPEHDGQLDDVVHPPELQPSGQLGLWDGGQLQPPEAKGPLDRRNDVSRDELLDHEHAVGEDGQGEQQQAQAQREEQRVVEHGRQQVEHVTHQVCGGQQQAADTGRKGYKRIRNSDRCSLDASETCLLAPTRLASTQRDIYTPVILTKSR